MNSFRDDTELKDHKIMHRKSLLVVFSWLHVNNYARGGHRDIAAFLCSSAKFGSKLPS